MAASSFSEAINKSGVNQFVDVPARVSRAFRFTERDENPRFWKIETIATNAHVHRAKIRTLDDLDDEVRGWIDRAYRVGCREHLR